MRTVRIATQLAFSTVCAAWAPTARAQTAESVVAHELKTFLDSLSAADKFSGVVLLAHHDTAVLTRAYGLADRDRHLANTTETAFNLASVGKLFTQTAVQQLEHAGKLEDDSTIAAYWPDYPNADVARKVTIRQLLTMTSGIGGEIFGAPDSTRSLRTLKDYLRQFVNQPLEFEPGSRTAYSNAGYIVLGLLIERVSGEDYHTYVKRHVFDPAGMTRTGAFDIDSLPPNTAIGYTLGGANAPNAAPRANTAMLPGRGGSAGGGYSTAPDLLRYVRGVRNGAIPFTSGKPRGWVGGSAGANALVATDLPGDYTLIVLANIDPPVVLAVQKRVADLLRGS